MRHFVLPCAVAPGPRGMVAATTDAALITLTRGALSGAARLRGTPSLTVDVAAIAAGADQYLDAASCAQIEARGRFRLFGVSTDAWTNCAISEILPRHTCSRTVWGAAPKQTARLGSAPCLSSRKTDL
jgi:hypothetical protein